MLTSRPIHVAANGIISFLFVTEQDSFVHHIFFTHSSVSRHLGCVHVLIIVNSVAMNPQVLVSFQISFLQIYGLLDHTVTLYLVF